MTERSLFKATCASGERDISILRGKRAGREPESLNGWEGCFFMPGAPPILNCRKRRFASDADRLSAIISQRPQVNGGEEESLKSSTKDQAEGKSRKVKGDFKEIAVKLGMKPELEAEGKDERIAGKVQEVIGQVKKIRGK